MAKQKETDLPQPPASPPVKTHHKSRTKRIRTGNEQVGQDLGPGVELPTLMAGSHPTGRGRGSNATPLQKKQNRQKRTALEPKLLKSHQLTTEQHELLLEMMAAGFSRFAVNKRFTEEGWIGVSKACYTEEYSRFEPQIDLIKKTRYLQAMSHGLAIRAERIQRLKDHAEKLFQKIWWVDSEGNEWMVVPVERAWRETLRQIAEEMGHLKYIEPANPRDGILQRMHDLGLTLEDIAKDAVAAELFRNLGIELPDQADAHRLAIESPR